MITIKNLIQPIQGQKIHHFHVAHDLAVPFLMGQPLFFDGTAAVILPFSPEQVLGPRPTLKNIHGFHGK